MPLRGALKALGGFKIIDEVNIRPPLIPPRGEKDDNNKSAPARCFLAGAVVLYSRECHTDSTDGTDYF